MEGGTPTRASGIPRPSKLPAPSTTRLSSSAIPRPSSTTPRPSPNLRPRASVDGLRRPPSSSNIRRAADESRSPRLGPSSLSSHHDQPPRTSPLGRVARSNNNPPSRATASRDPWASGHTSPSSASTSSHTPSTSITVIRGGGGLARPGSAATPDTSASDTSDRRQEVPAAEPTSAAADETDDVIFKRHLTLTRRPSESPAEDAPAGSSLAEVEPAVPDVDMAAAMHDAAESSPSKSRPSLAERTVETLARVPPSPAPRRKSSAFFDQGRPKSRPESAASRPGSSHTSSDGSVRVPPRTSSRPGSSAGREQPAGSRASSNPLKVPLSTFNDGPLARASSGPQLAQTQTIRKAPSRPSLTSVTKNAGAAPALPGNNSAQTPSAAKKSYGALPIKSGSKTLASRPAKPRNSAGALFKKTSLSAINLAAADPVSVRSVSLSSARPEGTAWDGSIPAPTSPASLGADQNDAAAGGAPSPLSGSCKSSAALRDQIARAKAAKRAALKQGPPLSPTSGNADETPIVPSDDTFDFGMTHDDPFNLRKGENPKRKLLERRAAAARSTGKLNIAGLGLKEMPAEVTKMYELESIGANDGSWAESVDLTRLVAADNDFERLDDAHFPDSDPMSFGDDNDQGSIFGGLETIDLHNNLLVGVPLGFRWLGQVTSLNLTSNRLTNDCIEVISQMTSLRDLKLAKNLFFGPMHQGLSKLSSLEILDLHGNNISALPRNMHDMARLRMLNLSENSFESLPFEELARLPLTDLQLRKNKLSGTLIDEPIDALPELQTLDASSNNLERLVPLGTSIALPVLHALSLSMNRLQGLPDMTSWTSLLTLTVDENSISGIPNSFTTLERLRHADFSSNDIRVVPAEVAKMDSLTMLRLSGNPLRDRRFVSMTTEELKDALAARLEPPPPYHESGPGARAFVPSFIAASKAEMAEMEARAGDAGAQPGHHDGGGDGAVDDGDNDSRSDMDECFATPPTSAPQSPERTRAARSRSRSQTVSSLRSRSRTLSSQTWPVRPGGVLDRSRTESSSLHPVVCSKVAAEHRVREVRLQHNLFAGLPNSLSFFSETLTVLSLAGNQLVGESYLGEDMDFLALRELDLSSNRITTLEPLARHLRAPVLEKLDVSFNRLNALPRNLKDAFPMLRVLLASNNQIAELEPDMVRGLGVVDASSNDISRLNPKLGLLGGSGGLERLDVMGNRFRVPRWSVLERGTDATLRWLRSRVPVAEMAAWRGENGSDDFGDVD